MVVQTAKFKVSHKEVLRCWKVGGWLFMSKVTLWEQAAWGGIGQDEVFFSVVSSSTSNPLADKGNLRKGQTSMEVRWWDGSEKDARSTLKRTTVSCQSDFMSCRTSALQIVILWKWILTLLSVDQNLSSPPVWLLIEIEQAQENGEDFFFSCVSQIRTGLVSFEFDLQGGSAD